MFNFFVSKRNKVFDLFIYSLATGKMTYICTDKFPENIVMQLMLNTFVPKKEESCSYYNDYLIRRSENFDFILVEKATSISVYPHRMDDETKSVVYGG